MIGALQLLAVLQQGLPALLQSIEVALGVYLKVTAQARVFLANSTQELTGLLTYKQEVRLTNHTGELIFQTVNCGQVNGVAGLQI